MASQAEGAGLRGAREAERRRPLRVRTHSRIDGVSRTKTPAPRRAYTPRMPAEQRREQLMDAALDVIERDGYGAVSVESIVREVDVTRPVFYNVFGTLDELLSSLLDRQESRVMAQLTTTVSVPQLGDDLQDYLRAT